MKKSFDELTLMSLEEELEKIKNEIELIENAEFDSDYGKFREQRRLEDKLFQLEQKKNRS